MTARVRHEPYRAPITLDLTVTFTAPNAGEAYDRAEEVVRVLRQRLDGVEITAGRRRLPGRPRLTVVHHDMSTQPGDEACNGCADHRAAIHRWCPECCRALCFVCWTGDAGVDDALCADCVVIAATKPESVDTPPRRVSARSRADRRARAS